MRDFELDDADGPLIRAASARAEAVDEADSSTSRRRAWFRFLPAAAAALAEGFLRDTVIWGAVLFSILAAAFGVASGQWTWAVPMVASGIAGIGLVCTVTAQRWPFGVQWVVFLGVLLVQCTLIFVQWRV